MCVIDIKTDKNAEKFHQLTLNMEIFCTLENIRQFSRDAEDCDVQTLPEASDM